MLVEGAGVVKAERTRRSLRFFGRLYVTRCGLGMAFFNFLEACRMGRCLLRIFVKPVSPCMWLPGVHSVVVFAVGRVVGLVDRV